MKIVFVSPRFPRLSHTFILHEMIELQRRGHELMILSVGRPTDVVVHPAVAEHQLLDVTHHVYSPSSESPDAAVPAERMGHRPAPVPFQEQLQSFAELVRARGFDVIHAAFGNRPASIARQLSQATGLPYTFELHAYDLYVDFPDAEEKLRTARRVFTISDYNRTYLEQELECPPEKIVVKRVSFDKHACDSLLSNDEDEHLAVSACRLHPIKGLFHVLEAIRLVARTHPKLRYVVLGDGPLRGDLERRVSELGISGQVDFRGPVAQPEVLDTLSRCAVSILASEITADGDRDGIPTAMVEAMCLGKPVISTRVSGIPELVEHGVNGLLADRADPHALAAHLELLLGDAKLRRAMGRRAREKVDAMFNIDRNMDLLEEGLRAATDTALVPTSPPQPPRP